MQRVDAIGVWAHIQWRPAPSGSCRCSSLREEERKGCLCVYVRDPAYSSYLNSTTARKALAACNVAYPTC